MRHRGEGIACRSRPAHRRVHINAAGFIYSNCSFVVFCRASFSTTLDFCQLALTMLFHAHLHGGYMKSTSARPCRCCSTQERGRRDAQPARHRLKRREAAAVPLRRSDLAYTKQLSFLVTGTELNLHTQLAGVSKEVRHLHPGVLNTHRRRLQAAEQSSMQVHLQVEGTGGVDHFVRIAIKGTLRLQCGACLGPCSWHINTGTQV